MKRFIECDRLDKVKSIIDRNISASPKGTALEKFWIDMKDVIEGLFGEVGIEDPEPEPMTAERARDLLKQSSCENEDWMRVAYDSNLTDLTVGELRQLLRAYERQVPRPASEIPDKETERVLVLSRIGWSIDSYRILGPDLWTRHVLAWMPLPPVER